MKKFVIKKGSHYASPKVINVVRPTSGKIYQWEVILDESCKYSITGVNQYDINKLCGLSFFNLVPNDKNSVRIGWRYNPTTKGIELFSYLHLNGKIHTKALKLIPEEYIEDYIRIIFLVRNSSIHIEVDTLFDHQATHHVVSDICPNDYLFAYENNVYFGGDEVAPHDITIKKEFSSRG